MFFEKIDEKKINNLMPSLENPIPESSQFGGSTGQISCGCNVYSQNATCGCPQVEDEVGPTLSL